jgi:hypothetical protein
MGKGGSILGAGCCVPRVGTGDDGGGLLADGNPDVLAEGCLANAGACNDFSSRVHVGASLGSRGDVLGISSSIPGMTAVGDGSSLLVDSGVNTLGTGCGGSDVRPSADSILGSITIGVGMGLGMGSGGGSGDLNTGGGGSVRDTCGGVLHGVMSMNRSCADLGSGALGHGDGLRRGFLCAPGGVWFRGVGPQHTVAVLAKTTMSWAAP